MIFLLQRFLNLRSQLRKNIIIGSSIILTALALMEQGNINQRHQRNCMLALSTLISLSIGIITVGYELGCTAIELFIGATYRHLNLFVIDVQPYMESVVFYFCH